jgi:hypothetical protein
MIDNNLLTRIFENILEKGEMTGIERDRISFKYKDKSLVITVRNEYKDDDKTEIRPLSVDRILDWGGFRIFSGWSTYLDEAIKPGVLLTYFIETPFQNYMVKPALSKQEEYKEKLNKIIQDFEVNYLTSLL